MDILDSFCMIKVWDLLSLPEEQVLYFLGNYHLFSLCITRGIILHHANLFPYFLCSKMIDLSVKEQKNLMLEAQATRRVTDQNASIGHVRFRNPVTEEKNDSPEKSNLKCFRASKFNPFATEEPSFEFPKEDCYEVCRADWEILSLMREASGRNQTRTFNEFKFRSNNFDGLKFLCDHLNTTEDVNKVKTIWRQKLTENPNSYLMRCVVLT